MNDKPLRVKSIGRLTDVAIKSWLSKDTPDTLHDGAGLYLRRRAEGAFWSLRRVNPLTNARTWAGLFPGVPYPTATLSEARRKASEARLRATSEPTDIVRDRQALLAAKRAVSAASDLAESRRVTVRQLFGRWASTELAPHIGTDGKRKGRKDGGQYTLEHFERRVFPVLGDTPVPAVTKSDLFAILDAAKAEGKYRTCNVLLTDLKQMLAFALDREIIDRNPLATVKKKQAGGDETQRDRVLTADEVKALAQAVPEANMSKRSAAAVWLILATGCRVGEAMGTRWEHVNLDARSWHLPTTKNQREHTIHLSAFALRKMRALAELREQGEDGQPAPWLFPATSAAATKPDGPVCVKSFGKQLADRQREPERRMAGRSKNTKALILAGGRWTAHDLRRTAATMMAEMGISGDTIDECLNHMIESRVRRTYIRDRRLAEQARAFDALGAKLEALIDGVDTSNVLQLRAA